MIAAARRPAAVAVRREPSASQTPPESTSDRIARELPACRWVLRWKQNSWMPWLSGYIAVAVNTRFGDGIEPPTTIARQQECGPVHRTPDDCREWIAREWDGGRLFPETILGVTESAWREWLRVVYWPAKKGGGER